MVIVLLIIIMLILLFGASKVKETAGKILLGILSIIALVIFLWLGEGVIKLFVNQDWTGLIKLLSGLFVAVFLTILFLPKKKQKTLKHYTSNTLKTDFGTIFTVEGLSEYFIYIIQNTKGIKQLVMLRPNEALEFFNWYKINPQRTHLTESGITFYFSDYVVHSPFYCIEQVSDGTKHVVFLNKQEVVEFATWTKYNLHKIKNIKTVN
ncbi:hypothetical protein [Thermicanus aegyptius]|uniref:hypothetical protein n=1 Tax=Thermicanus aegyptius TaxID=94009 RepID=UPI00048F1048|nr:hypothetical protein [Thermicanus aegyptius]